MNLEQNKMYRVINSINPNSIFTATGTIMDFYKENSEYVGWMSSGNPSYIFSNDDYTEAIISIEINQIVTLNHVFEFDYVVPQTNMTVPDGNFQLIVNDPVITEPIIYTGISHNLGNTINGIYNISDGFIEAFQYSIDNGTNVINHNSITKIKINRNKPEFNNILLNSLSDKFFIVIQKDFSGYIKIFIRQTGLNPTDHTVYNDSNFNIDKIRYNITIEWNPPYQQKFPIPVSKAGNNCLIEFNDGNLLIDDNSTSTPIPTPGIKVINIENDITIYGIEPSYTIIDTFDNSVEDLISQLQSSISDAIDDIETISNEIKTKFNEFRQMYVSR